MKDTESEKQSSILTAPATYHKKPRKQVVYVVFAFYMLLTKADLEMTKYHFFGYKICVQMCVFGTGKIYFETTHLSLFLHFTVTLILISLPISTSKKHNTFTSNTINIQPNH